MAVQWVNRPSMQFRGYSGTIASGVIKRGAQVMVHPSGLRSEIARIVTKAGDLDRGVAGQALTLVLKDEIDVSRGDVIASADAPPEVADQFEATVVWLNEQPLLRGRSYLMQVGT